MRRLLENWRKYSILTENQLLIEGRIDDAKAKYPELAKKREELDGESLMDVLIAKDPSGNQKYLMGAARILQRSIDNAEKENNYVPFWGKQWPEDAGDNLYSPWGVANNIAELLPKYHGLMAYIKGHDAQFKDINNIKTYATLQGVVTGAENRKAARAAEKEKKKRASQEAKQNSEVVDDNDHHMVIRPLSAQASCYFGKSTKWCISSERSANYFDEYTSDGKAFFFLLAKRKDLEPAFKKIAMVVDRDGDVEAYYDSEDDTMTESYFRDAIRQAMVGPTISGEMVSVEEDEPYDANVILDALETWKGINDFDFDREDKDDIRDLISMFNDFIVEPYISDLQSMARVSAEETPPGTPDEAYEEMLSELGDFDNIYVTLHFPYDTGAESVYWEAHVGVDLDNLLERAEGWEPTSHWEENLSESESEELRDLVDTMMNDVGVWPEEIEQDWGDTAVFNVRLEADSGSLDKFESWLENLNHDDDKISEGLLDAFIEHASEVDPPFIRNPEKEAEEAEAARQLTRDAEYWPDPEEKKKQLDLPLQENRFRIKIIKK